MTDAEHGTLSPLTAGAQALVETDRGIPLDRLPADAYENLLVVSTTQTPQKVEAAIERGGGDPADVGVVPVSGSQSDYDGTLWTADRVDPSDLTGLSMRFSDAARYLQPGRGWVVVDNLTVLLMYAPERRVYRFLSAMTSTLRDRDVRAYYGVVRTAMNEETYEQLRGLVSEELAL